jgi:hypothetical protein
MTESEPYQDAMEMDFPPPPPEFNEPDYGPKGEMMETAEYQEAYDSPWGADGGFMGGPPPGPGDFGDHGDGMSAMDAAMDQGDANPAFPEISPADAALGSAFDSAMDQGGAPAAGAEPAMDETAGADIVDPGMDDEPGSDDDGGLAG